MFALALIHLLASAAPTLAYAFLPNAWFNHLSNAAGAVAIGSLMLLAFWLGLGGGEFLLRLVIAGFAVVVLAFGQFLVEWIRDRYQFQFQLSDWKYFAINALMYGLFVGLVAVGFLVTRIWLIVDRPLVPEDVLQRGGIKFSMFHLLAVMTLCAVIFPLIQVARRESHGPAKSLSMMAALGLGYSAFFANTLAAAYAALGRRPLAPRIAVSFIAAIALGLMLSFAVGRDADGWETILSEQVIFVVATAVIIGSLLVVRSCGYRLIWRPPHSWNRPASATAPPQRSSAEPRVDPFAPESGHA